MRSRSSLHSGEQRIRRQSHQLQLRHRRGTGRAARTLTCIDLDASHARDRGRDALLRRHGESAACLACAGAFAARYPVRPQFVADRLAAGRRRSACRNRRRVDCTDCLPRRLFALHPQIAMAAHCDNARAARAMGRLRVQSRRMGSGVPRLRLHRRQVVLAQRRDACGNGGFSLRSRRLLQALQDPRIALSVVEDETICRTFRPLLERDYGIRFAGEARRSVRI